MKIFLKKLKHRLIAFLAWLHFYGNPSKKIKIIGVTGTNGKTTTTTLLYQLFRDLGYKIGMIGTVVNKINDESIEAKNTTPGPIILSDLLNKMIEAGCEYCFMEVSSHAIDQNRIAGIKFTGAVFTNLTHDHLDYHKTFENYRDTKKGFFDSLSESSFALSNKDDENGEYMVKDTPAKKYFYSRESISGMDFSGHIDTKLLGEFNQSNMLAVLGVAVLLGQDQEKVKEEIKKLDGAPGRFASFTSPTGVIGIVDYAHTPDALLNALKTINTMKKNGKLISVFGCGGDRDRTKRPLMAKIGYDMSDIVVLTSDNPRTENPESILEDMKKGLSPMQGESLQNLQEKVYVISDRREAIKKACNLAQEGDYILLAGKGHEKYQEINGVKTHFDDMEELKKYLQ